MKFLPVDNRSRGERLVLQAVARYADGGGRDEPTTTNQDPETAMQGESRMAKQGAGQAGERRNRALSWITMAAALLLGAGVAQAAPSDIYRFYHLDAGRHFYTASTAERDKVLSLYPRFAYEGPRFQAYLTQETGTVPVYRFYHQGNGSHVYSASEAEKSTILSNYPIYAYEGIAYYAETNGNSGAVAVLRLYNTKLGTHFFTTSASEAAYATPPARRPRAMRRRSPRCRCRRNRWPRARRSRSRPPRWTWTARSPRSTSTRARPRSAPCPRHRIPSPTRSPRPAPS
jgi:Repeat of unknown function (DUF5648)